MSEIRTSETFDFPLWCARMYYLCNKTKGGDQLHSYSAADLRLFLPMEKSRFSHEAAHIIDVVSIFSSPEPKAHRRLIGELIGYSWSGVRPSSSVVNNFKSLLLRNRLADQSQILYGASLGRGNEILFAASGSHDQDGRHAHIW